MMLNQRLFRLSSAIVLLLTTSSLYDVSEAYVTSPHAVPYSRQMIYLKELTTDLVSAAPGQLSAQQLAASHDLMYAWSHTHSMNKECAIQVESLVKRVIEERQAGNIDADLTVDDYNCLLEGWARSGLAEASATRTEQILEAMQEQGPKPNLTSFKACLMAWRMADVDYAAVRAQRILEWMIRLYNDGENKHALPDSDCFDIVLQIWSRSGLHNAPERTEHLVKVMERLHRSISVGGDNNVRLLKPRTTSFNAVLAAWSKSGKDHAADRASDILHFMEKLNDPDVAPDAASYNIVMNTYGRTTNTKNTIQAAIKADAFLKHVVNVYEQQEEVNNKKLLQPDTILFNTVMGLWGKTNKPGSYLQARSILDQQIELAKSNTKIQPDVFGFTSVLSSCAGEKVDKQKAFRTATATYKLLKKYDNVHANHVTYGTMLKCTAKLLPQSDPLRRKWIRRIFTDAISTGCVGDMVISKLREASSPDLYKELMQGYTRKNLPFSWTENVHEQNTHRLKRTSNNNKRNRRKRAEV